MSMINEQVKELRKAAKWFDAACFPEGSKLANEAADTIESLSFKLQAKNMELAAEDYGGGWIACSEKLPDKNGYYIIQTQTNNIKIARYHYNTTREYMAFWIDHMKVENVVAWQPLPEPYQQN